MSGSSGNRPANARCTQSVGVPVTLMRFSAKDRARIGEPRVRELEAPERSRSGATMKSWCPAVARPSARAMMPGASMPSSLLMRMRIPE